MSQRFDFQDGQPEDDAARQFVHANVDWLLRQCVDIPSAYWPQLVNTACQRLLDRGVADAAVRRIYRRTVRELRLTPEPRESP